MLFDDSSRDQINGESQPQQLDAKARERERKKAYYEVNREWLAERGKAYREANRERIAEKNKAYYEANRERIAEKNKAYREAYREQLKAYREANRERISERGKAWYEANRERLAEQQKAYREANRDRVAERKKARNLVRKEREAIRHFLLVNQRGLCASCGIDSIEDHHLDHIVPLAKGGSNDRSNFQILCPTCNLKKHATDPVEFARRNGKLVLCAR